METLLPAAARWAAALVLGALWAGCSADPAGPGGGVGSRCTRSTDCSAGLVCRDGHCASLGDGGGMSAPDAAIDAGPECPPARACGAACCPEGEVCGGGSCCAATVLCGGACCGADERCEADRCVLDCGATRAECGTAAGDVCCAEGDVCYLAACATPGATCASTRDCPDGAYCEVTIGRCLPRATGELCEYHPPVGPLELVEEWHWSGDATVVPANNQVMMAPMVANLTDDNADGRIDQDDVPDVVFHTFTGSAYSSNGVLRVVSGRDGSRIWPTADPGWRTHPGGELAIGDVDPASPGPEIAACSTAANLMLVSAAGTVLRDFPTVPCGYDAPAIGDMDNDGVPEIVVRFVVAHADGTIVGRAAGAGGGYTTLADVDGDGTLEIVGSAGVYRIDGTAVWERLVAAPMRPAIPAGGSVAIGDLDLDGDPEVVVITSGDHSVRVVDARTGDDVWGPTDINPLDDATVAADVLADTRSMGSGGGAPTIANFDADPNPEIAFAGGFAYVIFNHDGTRLWYDVTVDRSSRVTGSSVFDFEGDGVAEVAYNDERTLRIYRGPDGMELYSRCNTSGTLREYPIVVDVDNDDHAELVVMENNYAFACLDGTPSSTGIYVFGHPRNEWVRTRRIWNEHTYHVTNINEDGTVPARETPNWSAPRLNNFRQNVQPDGLFDAPDLVVEDLRVSLRACPVRLDVTARVVNRGSAGVPAGIPVTFYEGAAAPRAIAGRARTTRPLLPGESELVTMDPTFALPAGRETDPFTFEATVNAPDDMPLDTLHECRPTNNTAGPTTATCPSLG